MLTLCVVGCMYVCVCAGHGQFGVEARCGIQATVGSGMQCCGQQYLACEFWAGSGGGGPGFRNPVCPQNVPPSVCFSNLPFFSFLVCLLFLTTIMNKGDRGGFLK